MISLNSLAAFTQEVTRSAGIQQVRGPERPEAAGRAASPAPPRRAPGPAGRGPARRRAGGGPARRAFCSATGAREA